MMWMHKGRAVLVVIGLVAMLAVGVLAASGDRGDGGQAAYGQGLLSGGGAMAGGNGGGGGNWGGGMARGGSAGGAVVVGQPGMVPSGWQYGGAPAIAVSEGAVFVTQGSTLYKFDAMTLEQLGQVKFGPRPSAPPMPGM